MTSEPHGAGGFIWAFIDEGLVRDDQNGAIDVNGNSYPDGILGPHREKEGSFYAIKDIWSPLQIGNRAYYETRFSDAFDGQVSLDNHYSFTNADQCRFSWKLVNFPAPDARQTANIIIAQGRAVSPAIAAGASGKLSLALPANWRDADALRLSARDPFGRETNRWTWPIKRAADFQNRIVRANATAKTTAIEDAQNIVMTADTTVVSISKSTGLITEVRRDGNVIGLSNGPTIAASPAKNSPAEKDAPKQLDKSELKSVTHAAAGNSQTVEASFSGHMASVRYTLQPNGWLCVDYKCNLSGPQDYMGVSFDLPEQQVKGVKWLGVGPYRVWKNRMRGGEMGVWSKAYNDTATGADTWQYPEFKGYHARTYWAQLQTTNGHGPITMVTPEENLFLRLYTPRNGPNPKNAPMVFPSGDISFLDGIAPIGNKFKGAETMGPQGAPNIATGDYSHTLFFHFGKA